MFLAADVSPWADALNMVLVALASVVTALIGLGGKALVVYINAKTKAGAVQTGLDLAAVAGQRGALIAFETYTKAIKAARADGHLTDEEVKGARAAAWKAALEALGTQGVALVQSGLGDGWEATLRGAIEHGYANAKRPPGLKVVDSVNPDKPGA